MKLLELAKRGSGRVAVMQFTMSEILSIIALYEAMLKSDPDGHGHEKRMLQDFRKVIGLIEDLIVKKQDYRNYGKDQGVIAYRHNPLDENDPVQKLLQL